jgi:hypothetical protein
MSLKLNFRQTKYPNFPPIGRGLSEEKSENLKKIVTAAYRRENRVSFYFAYKKMIH